jgi:hypothetical protein
MFKQFARMSISGHGLQAAPAAIEAELSGIRAAADQALAG